MRFSMFSIVVGDNACWSKCPFCVSSEKPNLNNLELKDISENAWRNFETACLLAEKSGVQTVMLTSMGEPMLYINEIEQYLNMIPVRTFPFIELQTNGVALMSHLHYTGDFSRAKMLETLKRWRNLGLNIITISMVSNKSEINQPFYTPNSCGVDMSLLIDDLHDLGFTVRLTCIMCKGIMDTPEKVLDFLAYAKQNKVAQVTMRGLNDEYRRESAHQWIIKNKLTEKDNIEIHEYFKTHGTKLYDIPKIGTVYDMNGQNCMLSMPLTKYTENTDSEHARNLIFFRSGRVMHEWEKEGAILL